jgi:Protein of unknown function (DUF2786)
MSSIQDKIRKLLALSESSNQNEAMAAIAKANELIASSGITLDTLEEGIVKATHVSSSKFEQQHDNWILGGFQAMYGYKSFASVKTNNVYIFGLESSIELGLYMLAYVRESMNRELKAIPKALKTDRTFNRYFRRGYALTVASRLRALSKNPEVSQTSAIVLVGNLTEKIEAKLAEDGYRVKSPAIKVRESDGLAAGQSAAQNLGLNKQVLSNQRALPSA